MVDKRMKMELVPSPFGQLGVGFDFLSLQQPMRAIAPTGETSQIREDNGGGAGHERLGEQVITEVINHHFVGLVCFTWHLSVVVT